VKPSVESKVTTAAAPKATPPAAPSPAPEVRREQAAPQLADAAKASVGESAAPAPAPRRATADQLAGGEILASRLAAPAAPPVAEVAQAAASPWQRQEAAAMPEGGTLLRDARGQVLGRVVVQGDVLWWQPWVDGAPAAFAQRAALSPPATPALRQRLGQPK
jgi:hypothetical protein